MTSSPNVNLLDLDAQGLVAYCDSLGEKPFRAKQLQRWIHQYNAADFDGMTDLAKSLREKLKGRATISMPATPPPTSTSNLSTARPSNSPIFGANTFCLTSGPPGAGRALAKSLISKPPTMPLARIRA